MANVTITKAGSTGSDEFTLASDGSVQVSITDTSKTERNGSVSLQVDDGSVYKGTGIIFKEVGTYRVQLKAGSYRLAGRNINEDDTTYEVVYIFG